jgi:hypothetical protein
MAKKPDTLFLLHTLSIQVGALLSQQLLWDRRYLATATDRGDGDLGVEYRGRRGVN